MRQTHILVVAAILVVAVSALPSDAPSHSNRRSHLVIYAHGDDWQLFAGDLIADYLKQGDAATFIQLTKGVGNYSCWERGTIASIVTAIEGKVVALSCNSPDDTPAKCSTVVTSNHKIKFCHYRNAGIYFLRLPATFCPFCGHQLNGLDLDGKTMLDFYLKFTQPISAKDGSTTFRSWQDLVETIMLVYPLIWNGDYGNIMGVEPHGIVRVFPREGVPNVSTDHLDHGIAGCVAIDVYRDMTDQIYNLPPGAPSHSLGALPPPGLLLFRGYDSVLKPPNLTDDRLQTKKNLFIGAFAGTTKGDSLGDPNSKGYHDLMARTVIEEQIAPGTGAAHEGCDWIRGIQFVN